jgi:hypothetical protein
MNPLFPRSVFVPILISFALAGCRCGPREIEIRADEKRISSGKCDPNYTPCVPIDRDVDCAGGKGDGPSYVRGPVRVVGVDRYGLDQDGDGVGCEN